MLLFEYLPYNIKFIEKLAVDLCTFFLDAL
jgi:hypothetical protein